MRNSSEFLTFLTVPLCCCKLLLCDGHMTNKLLLHPNTTSTDVSQYAVASHPPQPLMYHILFLHNGLNKQIAVAPQPPTAMAAVAL